MKMSKWLWLLPVMAVLMADSGAQEGFVPHRKIRVAKAVDFKFDGGIDSPVWKNQPQHKFMCYVTDVNLIGRAPVESGSVQYLYDDRYLYVRAHFTDSDVMTTATAHGGHFYIQGDVLELFVKPAAGSYYWEIYGSPNKLRTRFHYQARGMLGLPSGFAANEVPILVDAKVDGTLNDARDTDRSWTVLLGVPRRELEKYGTPFAPGNTWYIFASRYNYGAGLPKEELSSFPQIQNGYHSHEHYAEIIFGK